MANVESNAPQNGPHVLDLVHDDEERADALEQWSTVAIELLSDVRADFRRLELDGPGSRDTLSVKLLRAAIDEFSAMLSVDEAPRFQEPDSRFTRVRHPIPFLDKPITTMQAWEIIPAHHKASISPFGVSVGDESRVASIRYGITKLGAAEVQQISHFLQKRRDIGNTGPLHFTAVVNPKGYEVLVGCDLPVTLCMEFNVSIVAAADKVPPSADLQSSPWIPAKSTISPERLARIKYKESSVFRFQFGAAQVHDQTFRPPISSAHMVPMSVSIDVEFLEYSIMDCSHRDFAGLCEYAGMLLVREKLSQVGYIQEGHWDILDGFTVLLPSENSASPGSFAHCVVSSLTITDS